MTAPSFKKILPYALVVFFGYVGFSLPLPILPEMFLDQDVGILSPLYTRQTKTILLGIVMAAYPFGQLFGAPILGKFSDLLGRKKVILFSLLGSMLGYIVTAIATQLSSVLAIFFGLFFCGLCEGNVAIAQSVVADLSADGKDNNTVSSFGWINLFTCFAFIVGPLIGGLLSNSSYVPWFTFATPFWMAAFMTLVGVFVVLRFSQETRSVTTSTVSKGYWKGFQEGMRHKKLRFLYVVNFFLALGYFSYFRFFPVYIESKFSFNSSMLGYVIAYGSVTFACFSALLLKTVAKWMEVRTAVAVFSSTLALAFFFILVPNQSWSVWFTTLPVSLSLCIVMTYSAVLVSEVAPKGFQGQAFGMLTSVQVLAEVLTGLLGGVVTGIHIALPMIIGSCMLLVGSCLVFCDRNKEGVC